MRVDAVFRNGRFWTGDPARPEATAIAVHQGRIFAIDDLDGLEGDRTFYLGGARVVPGLHDAHHHFGLTGIRLSNVDVRSSAVSSLDELYSKIRERAMKLPEGAWLVASGYDQNHLDGHHPTADELDRVAGGRPVYVEHVSGHMLVANTRAFELAHAEGRDGYPDIDGGVVIRDAQGRPQGLLMEAADYPIRTAAAGIDDDGITRNLQLANDQSVSYGLTSITEPGVVVDGGTGVTGIAMHHYQQAIAEGVIRPRLTVMPYHGAMHEVYGAPEGWRTLDWGLRTGFGDDRLRIGAVKIIADGSLIGRSAAVRDCFCGDPDNTGVMVVEPDALAAEVLAYHRAGWSIATHAIGDRAIDHVLDAVEAAQGVAPRPDARHRIEHFAIATDAQVRRSADLGVIPSPQGVFISDFGDGMLDAIGAERAAGTYRMRSLLDAGMVVPGSSDSPVSDANPFVSMHDLVNRLTATGAEFGPGERVSIEEALTAYTYGSAYAAGVEGRVGRLMPGMLADFVVLSDDLLAVEREAIRDVQAVTTVIGGEVVFERG